MRKTILSSVILLIGMAASVEAGLNHWTPIGPFGGEIQALASDPGRSAVVYAGTRGGVFKSTDGGVTWRRTSRGLKGEGVYALAVSPSNRNVVYAGNFKGLFVSRDAGETWQGPLPTLPAGILSLAVDPRDARRIWAGTQVGLAWSRDGGATWSFADIDGFHISRIPDIVVDPVHPDTVYAANEPVEDESLHGVLKTTDGGATWRFLRNGLDALGNAYDRMRLAVDPTSPNVVYVSTDTFAAPFTFRSADGGATWSETPGGYPVAVDSQGVAYAGAMRSFDHGATWEEATAPPPWTLEYLPNGGALLAATTSFGVFRSPDRSATWQSSSEGLHATTVTSIAIDPELRRVIYTGVYEMGIRKTLSSGLRWRAADAGLPAHQGFTRTYRLLAVDPRETQTVYTVSSQDFARSEDGGGRWTVLSSGHIGATDLLVDPASGAVYLAGWSLLDGTCRLARSDDRGETFRCLAPFAANPHVSNSPVWPFLDPARPGTLWVLERRDRLWKSTDRGEHWTEIRARGLGRAGDPRSLVIDPSRPGRLYLGTDRTRIDDRPERVWRSDDGGRTWRPWGKGLPEASAITHLLMDPTKPSIFYAAVLHHRDPSKEEDRSGVYWSRDGGRTFTPLRDGLPGGAVLDLVQDPGDPRKLYAGTWYNGVYTFTRK